MATLIEREVHHDHAHDDSAGSALIAIVAILAVVLIVGLVLYLFQAFPFNAAQPADTNPTIDMNVDGQIPALNPTPTE